MDEATRGRLRAQLGARLPPGGDEFEKVERLTLLARYLDARLLPVVLRWLARPEISEATVKLYADDLISFGAWCRRREKCQLSPRCGRLVERRWVQDQRRIGVSAGSIDRKLITWRSLLKFVRSEGNR